MKTVEELASVCAKRKSPIFKFRGDDQGARSNSRRCLHFL
jgi:hypothetical protein